MRMSELARQQELIYTMIDKIYQGVTHCSVEEARRMALNIKNSDVERLVDEVASIAGESKTEAVRKALEERRQRLAFQVAPRDRREEVMRYLEREVWPRIPPEILDRGISREEQDEILGYGAEGV